MFAPFYIPLCGDAVIELAKLESQSVQCCITSPPYYGLRDYGVEGQIGLEETPEQYIAKLVEVFAGVCRVLRDDGTLWIVIGDSYAGGGGGNYSKSYKQTPHGEHVTNVRNRTEWLAAACVKAKDLLGIPWLLAFALRDAGWYLRQEIIWAKSISGPVYRGGSCMPESVTDRCTRSHETVFMFSKSERYFYDAEAMKEESIMKPQRRLSQRRSARDAAMRADRVAPYKLTDVPEKSHTKRNMRSVWHMNPKPFKGAHFATYPVELITPMVLAGTSEYGCCSACGAPYSRVVERKSSLQVAPSSVDRFGTGKHGVHRKVGQAYQNWLAEHPACTVGWAPGCTCNAPIVPCMVLDPFSGAGTTALVALQHGRNAIGIELNPEYIEIARKRLWAAEVL